MDKVSKKRRSEIMSLVRSKNTRPELVVRSLVHRLGYRYRLHLKRLPGCPDLVFGGRKKVVFVHGCFWHGHRDCPKGKLPKSNLEYWKPKLKRNKKRDLANQDKLGSKGWAALVVWQCELKDLEILSTRIAEFLEE